MKRILTWLVAPLSRFGKFLAWLPVIVSPRWVNDTFGVIGLGLLSLGCGWIYPPLSVIVLGAALLTFAILGAMRKRREQGERNVS